MVRIQCTEDFTERQAVIKVIGVGGGGGNAVNRMVEAGIKGVEFISLNTDAQDLRRNRAPVRIQIGENLTKGLGVGGDPARGRQATQESCDNIKEVLVGADLIFVTAGMGGGTGTGGAPVVAQIARETNALIIGVVTRPFAFEGRLRAAQAESGIKEMRNFVDSLLVIPNDRLFNIIEKSTSTQDAYRLADDVLRQAIQGISDVITASGDINVDFADVKKIMANSGDALIGIGQMSGPNRHMEAAKKAIHSPLLENAVMEGASGILVNFSGGKDTTLSELKEAMEFIHKSVSHDANVKFGQAYDETLGDAIKITVIATGFPNRRPGRMLPRKRRGVKLPYQLQNTYQENSFERDYPRLPHKLQRDCTPWLPTGLDSGIPDELIKPAYLRIRSRKLK